MTHRLIVPLLLAAGALVGPLAFPAAAQEPPAAPEGEEAEVAFLRAYYLEKGLRDLEAAAKSYDEVARTHADDSVVLAKALIGRLRCLVALGRADEARTLQTQLEEQFAGSRKVIAQVRRVDLSPSTKIDAGVFENVMKALRHDWYGGVLKFGTHAVPTLASTLRTPDPDLVERAAQALVRIGDDAACAALADAIQDESILLRDQLLKGCGGGAAIPDALGLSVLAMPDSTDRTYLIKSAASRYTRRRPGKWLVDAVIADAQVRETVFGRGSTYGHRPRLALLAAVSGNADAREEALRYVRATSTDEHIDDWIDIAVDPPEGVLADAAVLAELAERVYTRRPDREPSAALFQRVAGDPAMAALAQRWRWFHDMELPMDAEAFLASLERDGWHVEDVRWGENDNARIDVRNTLHNIFGNSPDAEQLRRLTATWPDALLHTFEQYSGRLLHSSDVGEQQVRAMYAGSRSRAFRDLITRGIASDIDDRKYPAWIVDVLLTDLETCMDEKTRRYATAALTGAYKNAPKDARIDWRPHHDRLAALIEDPELASRLIPLLAASRPRDGEALAAALRPESPVFKELCDALVRSRSAAGANALRPILLAPAAGHKMERSERQQAAYALVKLTGDDAEETLTKALAAPDRGVANAAFSGLAMGASRLSVPVRTRLALAALQRQPDGISPWDGSFGRLLKGVPATGRGDLVRTAFGSPDESTRSWAANEALESLSPGYVDALVALLADPAHAVRANARRALLKYRQVEDDSDWVRSIATRRALAEQIDALLESDEAQHRMAGIAGLVAHGGPDVAARLLEVAASDRDDDVAAEARQALMALGRPSRTIADTARTKKEK